MHCSFVFYLKWGKRQDPNWMRPGQRQTQHRNIGKGHRACWKHVGLGLDNWWAREINEVQSHLFSKSRKLRQRWMLRSQEVQDLGQLHRPHCSEGGLAKTTNSGGFSPIQASSGRSCTCPQGRSSSHLVSLLRLLLWGNHAPPGLCLFPLEVSFFTR